MRLGTCAVLIAAIPLCAWVATIYDQKVNSAPRPEPTATVQVKLLTDINGYVYDLLRTNEDLSRRCK